MQQACRLDRLAAPSYHRVARVSLCGTTYMGRASNAKPRRHLESSCRSIVAWLDLLISTTHSAPYIIYITYHVRRARVAAVWGAAVMYREHKELGRRNQMTNQITRKSNSRCKARKNDWPCCL
jgi:hypothetical protein